MPSRQKIPKIRKEEHTPSDERFVGDHPIPTEAEHPTSTIVFCIELCAFIESTM
jgi:hypothetical protein